MAEKYFKNLMIEPTNICNLNCPICPTGNDYHNKNIKGSMTFQQFRNIIDIVKDFLGHINLWRFGEPFLAPDIIKMINYVGKNNILIKVHTNGNILDKKIMDQFKKNYRLNITFSIDGIKQKSYGYYRKDGDLKKVLDNLSYLVNLKEKYNLFNVQIIWQFLVMKTNEHEISDVRKLAKKMKVDELRLKTIGINKKNFRYNDFVPKNKKYQRENNKYINLKECSYINPGMPNILWNGDILPCCMYYPDKQYIMGNALKENLLDIWNSEKYKKFREDYKNGINDFCNNICNKKRKFAKNSIAYVKEFNFQANK